MRENIGGVITYVVNGLTHPLLTIFSVSFLFYIVHRDPAVNFHRLCFYVTLFCSQENTIDSVLVTCLSSNKTRSRGLDGINSVHSGIECIILTRQRIGQSHLSK